MCPSRECRTQLVVSLHVNKKHSFSGDFFSPWQKPAHHLILYSSGGNCNLLVKHDITVTEKCCNCNSIAWARPNVSFYLSECFQRAAQTHTECYLDLEGGTLWCSSQHFWLNCPPVWMWICVSFNVRSVRRLSRVYTIYFQWKLGSAPAPSPQPPPPPRHSPALCAS